MEELRYKYLISYCYNYQIINSDLECLKDKIFSGTGCMILKSSFNIETEADIEQTNKNLMNIIKVAENEKLVSVYLYSFNLLKG